MQILWLILILVVVGLVVLFVVASMKPDVFRLERQIAIKATPEIIAAHITDFHNWGAWSPWEKIDPTMTRSFSGADEGVGAVYDWAGTGKAGTGRMEIKAAVPSSAVVIALDFIKPFAASNTAEFTFIPEGDTTTVIWAMYGPAPFFSKVMHTVFNMDALVGKDFEKGLTGLKQISETA
jgi:hypothetical protein